MNAGTGFNSSQPQAEIKITIEADGQVKLEVIGAQGPSCLKLTHEIELALSGGDPTRVEHELKPEYEMLNQFEAEEETQAQTGKLTQGF